MTDTATLRASQGLPEKIRDAETLARLASIFDRAVDRRRKAA